MEQHKIEEQVGRQLRNREIKPSAQSWEHLNSRLEKEDRKSRPLIWVIAAAASIAAAFLILGLPANVEIIPANPAIVNTPNSVKEDVQNEQNELKKNEENAIAPVEQVASEEVKTPVVNKFSKENVQVVVPDAVVEEQQVASLNNTEEALQGSEIKKGIREEDEVIPQRLEEVIAAVSSEVNSSGDMTESEVDTLLYKAATEISLERDRENFSGRVDATALLRDVEMELDDSFREKVFDILKEGYLKARTAVASRNF